MTNLIILIVIPLALLVLLMAIWRRGSSEGAGRARPLPDDSEYWVHLPKRELLDRCLSIEDLEFVQSFQSRPLLQLLLHERRRLTREWLRQTRREALRLYRLHVRVVRGAEELRPAAELGLGVSMALFLGVYGAMSAVVLLYGPFRTRGFLGSLHVMANLLSQCGGRIAAGMPREADAALGIR